VILYLQEAAMDGTTVIVGAVLLFSGGTGTRDGMGADLSAPQAHEMESCPSAVPGSETTVVDEKDGVVVTVTAADPAARGEVRRRAHMHEDAALRPARDAVEEVGSGSFGRCPGIVEGTQVAVEDLTDGARLTVLGPSPSYVPLLQRMTRKRLRQLSAPR
jgi:hypothetical protein